jgi:hypothetical protein
VERSRTEPPTSARSGEEVATGPGDALAFIQSPERWPLATVLSLTHSECKDWYGLPQQGFLARGQGPRVYLASTAALNPPDLHPDRLARALTTKPSIGYASFVDVLSDGWNIG